MKKIALLFTLLCASQLYGMKRRASEHGHYVGIGMDALPDDVKPIIITYLNEYDNLDDIICAINATSVTNKKLNTIINDMYGNQEKFTALAHVLANRFDTTTETIATKFGTPTAKQYDELNKKLEHAFMFRGPTQIILLINEGVDANYTSNTPQQLPPLFLAVELGAWPKTLDIIQLLVERGANIHFTDPEKGTVIDYANDLFFSKYACAGLTQRKEMDNIIKFLLNTFCMSLNQDECEKIKKKYKRNLLSEEDISQIDAAIAERIQKGKSV